MARKRQGISPSLRWSIFARDGFTCRYCGAQAGQEGVELAADHVVSVAEGGAHTYDNLITACQKCNGGKGARSLAAAPTSREVIRRINDNATSLRDQAQAIAAALAANKQVEREIINLKCGAYEAQQTQLASGEIAHVASLLKAYGADRVLEWYGSAYQHGVPAHRAIRYVYGCVRHHKQDNEAAGVDRAK